jgi:hypothetical protein
MASNLSRGTQDEPLSDNITVLRACRLPSDYLNRAPVRSDFDFSLSSRDKEQPVPKLSVYVEGLTTPEQAYALVGDGTTHRLIAFVAVEAIQNISFQGHRLQAVWDDPILDDGSPDRRPGAEGHAGITGLRPKGMENAKAIGKALQQRLVDCVTKSLVVEKPPIATSLEEG